MLTVEGYPLEIAAGRASRRYNFDRSRLYHGVMGFRGPKQRGWLYDPNLVYSYNGFGAPADDPLITRIEAASHYTGADFEPAIARVADLMRSLTLTERSDAVTRATAKGADANILQQAMIRLYAVETDAAEHPVKLTPNMKIAFGIGAGTLLGLSIGAVMFARRRKR